MLNGALFTQTFLQEGITEYNEWKTFTDEVLADFRQQLLTIFNKFPTQGSPIEATIKSDLIETVLSALEWNNVLTQQTTSKRGHVDVPDYLSFETFATLNQMRYEAN